MFARVTWGVGSPDKIDNLVGVVRTAMESISQHEGYRGTALLANRSSGAAVAVTYWDSAEAMQASEATAENARATTVSSVEGFRITEVDRLEMVIQERTRPPEANAFLRVNDSRAEPMKLDASVEAIRESLPVLKAQPGFRAALVAVNRETGRLIASSVWNTAAEREASDAAIAPVRDKIRQTSGAESVNVELYEAVLADIKLTTPV
jgi:heme-degrading monooxygenase HmoA